MRKTKTVKSLYKSKSVRKLSAHYIYPVSSPPLKNGIIELDDAGKIIRLIDTNGELHESAGLEFYDGILVPGFVNTHCHLELSYLKGKIAKHTGHKEFIRQIVQNINDVEVDFEAISRAVSEMEAEGIVAVADISNRKISASAKQKSRIYFRTCVEIADFFDDAYGKKQIKYARQISDNFKHASYAAHAPYTCSPNFISEVADLNDTVFSIHNQEVSSEDEIYQKADGEMFNYMKNSCNFDDFVPTRKSSLLSYLPEISKHSHNILLVHNVFTSEDDLKKAEEISKNIYWCLCPLSNLYIQNRLPDVSIFTNNNCKITLGTDSLATNDRLSILEEMKMFNSVKFDDVLSWATLNGAKALRIDDKFGSLEPHKKSGVNLITNFDYKLKKLTSLSKVQAII